MSVPAAVCVPAPPVLWLAAADEAFARVGQRWAVMWWDADGFACLVCNPETWPGAWEVALAPTREQAVAWCEARLGCCGARPGGPDAASAEAAPVPYRCPACGMASWHPKDKEHHFCARCGRFEDDPAF